MGMRVTRTRRGAVVRSVPRGSEKVRPQPPLAGRGGSGGSKGGSTGGSSGTTGDFGADFE